MSNIFHFLSQFLLRLILEKDTPLIEMKRISDYRRLSRDEVLNLIIKNGGPEGLDLSYCDFNQVDLSNINFGGDWHNATVGANFEGSRFKDANLESCNLDFTDFQNASLINTNLSKTSLRAANCTNTNFRKCDFSFANLYRSQLLGADFFEANLELADLYRAKNLKDAIFYKSNFDCQILQETRQNFLEYLNIHMFRDTEQVLEQRFRRANEIYLQLKNAFTQQGRYQDARWAYLKERRTYRSAINPIYLRNNYSDELGQRIKFWTWKYWWIYLKFTIKWILSWIEDFSCGYGELPSRTIVLSLITILIFPIIYQQTGGISGVVTWLDYFNYSFGAFTTIGFNNFQAQTPISQVLTSFEALAGISMLALLMYTLGNRISRS